MNPGKSESQRCRDRLIWEYTQYPHNLLLLCRSYLTEAVRINTKHTCLKFICIYALIVHIVKLAVKVLPGVVDSMVSISGPIEETDLLNSGNKRLEKVLTGGLEAM